MPSSTDDALALAEAEAAEAEAAEAEALAAAATARARTAKLRKDAKATSKSRDVFSDAKSDAGSDDASDEVDEPLEPKSWRRWLPRKPSTSGAVTALAAVLLIAALTVSGLMLWRHHTVAARQDRDAAFIAAAKQSVVNLTSMNFQNAEGDVQRVIDSSTGTFRQDFEGQAGDFVSVVEGSNVVIKGFVNAVGIQSIEGNTAQMLVSASTEVSNSEGAERDPRAFRLVVTMVDEGGQIKMSKVEFVP